MTDDLKERLRHADEYEPLGHDGWEALARITDLEAKLQRLGRELNLAKYGEPDFAWEIHKNAVAELEARLAAAEAGEDALAEAIRITRERLMDAVHSEFDGVWSAEDFNEQEAEAVSALAAYEARREK